MYFILELLINAGVVMLAAYLMPQIEIKSYGKALLAAFLIAFLNATVGFLLSLPLNILTLGLLSFLVRLLVTAVVIKIADKLMTSFTVHGFGPAIVLAVLLALIGTLTESLFVH